MSTSQVSNSNYLTDDGTNDRFKAFVGISIGIHLALIFAVTVKNALFSNETIIIPQSMRVDIVALPEKPSEEKAVQKAAPKPVVKQEAPKPVPKPVVNVKDSQKKALDHLKELNAIDRIKSEVDAAKERDAEKKAAEEAAKPKQVKGNIVSSGSGYSGMSQLRVNEYLEDLTARLREHWAIPQYLSDANLKAAVVIDLDDRGNLVRREIFTSSGNPVFDSSCLAAVSNSAPFGPPPNELKSRTIMVRFPFE